MGRESEGALIQCPTYDVLVERSSVQPGNERLDGEERRQDTSEHGDESEDNWNARRNPTRSVKVLLQRSTTIVDVVVSKLLHLESVVGSPPNGDLAFDDLPVFHEDGGPKNENDRVVRGVGRSEQPEPTTEHGDDGESFRVSCQKVEV